MVCPGWRAALVVALGTVVIARPALPAEAPAPVRIMPLGDSITGSPGCWRAILWNRLQNTGYTNIDFVGTLGPQGCGQPYDGFSTASDTYDGVHPNAAGDQKMSDRWYPALTAALDGVTPTPRPTLTPTPPPTTTAPPAGGCTATYRSVGQWQGGFQGEVTVRNDGTAASRSWTVELGFATGQQVRQAWNATVSQSGGTVTARNVSWNGSLAPAGTATFGFIGSWTGSNPAPAVSCTFG